MKKKRCKAFCVWCLFLLVFIFSAFYTGEWGIIAGGFLWAVLPFASAGMNLYLRKNIQITVTPPAFLAKNKKATGEVWIRNSSVLPFAGLFCKLSVENRLTGEKETTVLEFRGVSAGEAVRQYEICSEHCGYLQVYPETVWLMDWIGFLPVRCKNIEKKVTDTNGTAVLPDTFRPHIYLHMAQNVQEDAESWSQTKKGNDLSEVFALREYIPGDEIKQIHWKLSSKRGQLIVREASLPVEKSLLIFWNKNTEKATPEEMDAMAECAASVSQEILNQGYSFTLGWTEGKRQIFETIENEDMILQTIPRMIKYGFEPVKQEEEWNSAILETGASFGKIIYLGKNIGADVESFQGVEKVFLLCGAGTAQEYNTISFRADRYQEDLQAIEI